MKSVTFLFSSLLFFYTAKASNYYFSALSGNDDRSEKQAQNPATPWKTLDKLNNFAGNLRPGDHVFLKRGETFYGTITINNSGTADMPIVISAYGTGQKPVITGLITLTNWVPAAGYKGVYESQNTVSAKNVNILLINNALQPLGRYPNADEPNKGYLTFESHYNNFSITDYDLPAAPNWAGAQVVIRTARWKLDRMPITAHEGNTISYKAVSKSSPADNYGYFIQNSIKTLDEFGEWYFDPSSDKMYVYFGQRSPSSYLVQASTVPNVITSDNADNLVFDNLTVKGANTYGFRINSSSNTVIQNCDILFSGNTGISTGKSSSNLTIQNCTVSYSNSWGIKLSNSINSVIKSNLVRNSGTIAGMGESESASYKGIEYGGSGNLVENNEVDSSGFMGIHMEGGENQMIRNNVVNTFGFIKDDGGGIYTQVGKNSTVAFVKRTITGNIILNGIGAQQGTNSEYSAANGIYMDDGANGVEITGNTVANTFRGIVLHNAYNIQISENTLYNNSVGCFMQYDGGANPIRNNTIIKNTFFAKSPKQFALTINTKKNDVDSIGTVDGNYYGGAFTNSKVLKQSYKNSSGKNVTEALSLSDWQNTHRKDFSARVLPITNTGNMNTDESVRFEYNPSSKNKTLSLAGSYKDINNNLFSNSMILKPYSSVILIKQPGRKVR